MSLRSCAGTGLALGQGAARPRGQDEAGSTSGDLSSSPKPCDTSRSLGLLEAKGHCQPWGSWAFGAKPAASGV